MTREEIRKRMFDCERKPETRVTKRTCIAKQKLLHEPPRNKKWRMHFSDAKQLCEGCRKGLELYNKSLKGEDDKMAKVKKDQSMKTCGDCGELLAANLENFDRSNRSGDGLTNDCLICRAASLEEATNKKPGSRSEQKQETLTLNTDPLTSGVYGVTILDLKQEPELMEKIQDWSKEQRRNPENQILWHLEQIVFSNLRETA